MGNPFEKTSGPDTPRNTKQPKKGFSLGEFQAQLRRDRGLPDEVPKNGTRSSEEPPEQTRLIRGYGSGGGPALDYSKKRAKSDAGLAEEAQLVKTLSQFGSTFSVTDLLERFNFSNSVLQSPEVQLGAQQMFIRALKSEGPREIVLVAKTFNLSQEFVRSPEHIALAKELILEMVRDSRPEQVQLVVDGDVIPDAVDLAEYFGLGAFLDSPEFQSALQQSVANGASYYTEALQKMKDRIRSAGQL